MRTCPKCWDSNLPTATACKRCGLPFDQTAVNLSRNCPAGRHVMDPTWTVCAFCKAEGLVTDDMDETTEPFLSGGAPPPPFPTPPPPFPRKTLFESAVEEGPGGTHSEEWVRKEEETAGEFLGEAARDHQGSSVVARRNDRTQFEGSQGKMHGAAGGTRQEVDEPPFGNRDQSADDWLKNRETIIDNSPAIPVQGARPMPETVKEDFGGGDKGGRRSTVYGGSGAPNAAAGDQRKIVAILITYTWKPEGQVFFVREGRNWIGRDPNQADIVVPQDDTLSSVNSTISFRSKFTIGDKDSMCGTWLNDKAIEELSHPLPNYSKIRTGSTTWTFIAVEPID